MTSQFPLNGWTASRASQISVLTQIKQLGAQLAVPNDGRDPDRNQTSAYANAHPWPPVMRHLLIGTSPCRGHLVVLLSSLLTLLLSAATPVAANVEKAIFLGPPAVNIPPQGPSLADLGLETLTPENTTLRLELPRRFPPGPSATPLSAEAEAEAEGEVVAIGGEASWFLLDNLNEGQRYEVRICWSALVRSPEESPLATLPPVT